MAEVVRKLGVNAQICETLDAEEHKFMEIAETRDAQRPRGHGRVRARL